MHFGSPSDPSQTAAAKAKLRCVLNFKNTWSEFQKPSQTAATQGEAELRILDFKTTWPEFQRSSQTAATRGEAKPVFHPVPTVGPKQLCALAHLGCTREAGTS